MYSLQTCIGILSAIALLLPSADALHVNFIGLPGKSSRTVYKTTDRVVVPAFCFDEMVDMNEMTAKGHHKWVIELDDDRWFHGKKKSSIEYDFYPLQRLIREGRVALDGDAKAFIKEQMKPGDSELEEDVSEMEEDSTDNELGEITANVENDIDMSIEAPNGDGRPGITYINSDSGFGFRRWYRAFTKKSIDAWKVEQNPKGGDMAHCWGAKVDLNTFGELKPGKKFRWVLYKRQYFLNFKKITVRRNGESFKSSKFPIIEGSN